MKHLMTIGVLAGAAFVAAATSAAAFDSRNPADVLSVLSTNGASGEVKKNEKGDPYIDAKAGPLSFSVNFVDCNASGVACGTAIYATGWNMTSITVEQINRWNRWTLMCPAYLNADNHPHAWYAIKPTAHETREDVVAQLNSWLSCLSDFDKFTDGPEAFLSAHE